MSPDTERRFRSAGYRISWVSRTYLKAALSRCSKRDRDLVLGWYDAEHRWQRDIEASARRDHQTYRDLMIVVADQRRHIADLEAQLLPHLVATPNHVQEQLA